LLFYYYYRDVVLMLETMPSIGAIAGDAYVFWQYSLPAHRVRQTIELVQC